MQTPLSVLLAGFVLVFVVVPLLRGTAQAWAERDAWAPFATRPNGRDGHLAPGRYFSALRAPRGPGRTTTGLVGRWVFWVAITVVLVLAVLRGVLSSA